jgi:Spy/CpxP family protein refolding chaperone
VEEAAAGTAAEKVMQREEKLKAVHLAMLVRVKNLLTPQQQAKLRAARDEERCHCAAGDAGAP